MDLSGTSSEEIIVQREKVQWATLVIRDISSGSADKVSGGLVSRVLWDDGRPLDDSGDLELPQPQEWLMVQWLYCPSEITRTWSSWTFGNPGVVDSLWDESPSCWRVASGGLSSPSSSFKSLKALSPNGRGWRKRPMSVCYLGSWGHPKHIT